MVIAADVVTLFDGANYQLELQFSEAVSVAELYDVVWSMSLQANRHLAYIPKHV